VPLDGSELAETILPHVETITKQWGAKLVEVVIIHVCARSVMPSYSEFAAKEAAEQRAVELASRKTEAKNYLANMKRRLRKDGLKVKSEVLVGYPAEQIVDYANEHPFNVVAMSTHARSGLGQWAFGSVAAKILEKVNSPLLLVRPPQSKSD
jgi:nucleotide-binding universal stress UspA family protein